MQKNLYIPLLLLFYCLANAQIKIGDSLPNFKLNNPKNEEISVSSFKGKSILIDFWASWCAPCRKGNKELVKLYNEADTSKFEIIGISIDKDVIKWKKAIEKDHIKFKQLNDPDGFDAPTAILFGVEELPSQYLFDTNGILVAINPTPEQIKKYTN
jgi:peroxiredoxin